MTASSHRYEICVRGPMPAALLAELGWPAQCAAPADTVLLTELIDQDALQRLLARIVNLGMELRELRLLTHATGLRRPTERWAG